MTYISIFSFLVAFIIVVTRLILNYLEERDRALGVALDPNEYKFSGIIYIILSEKWKIIKENLTKVKEKLCKGLRRGKEIK